MDLVGTWYLNPGDIPADFVFVVQISGAGTAIWYGEEVEWLLLGDRLKFRYPGEARDMARFQVRNDRPDYLSGHLVQHDDADPEDYEEGEEVPESIEYIDSAVLMRDTRGLRVITRTEKDAEKPRGEAETGDLFS